MILLGILIGLIVFAYKVIFMPSSTDSAVDDSSTASQAVEQILNQVNKINFDTSVTQDPKLNSLKSIETPLPSIPVGKKNPFSGF